MFALVFLGLVASASTAPWYGSGDYYKGFQDRMELFWDNFDRKMNNLNKNMENIVKHSKNQEWSKIENNEFKIFISMPGFSKEDIVVKAKKGNLVIQANHNVPGQPDNNFLYVRGLPDFVDENGSWSFNNNLLSIFFTIPQHGSYNTWEPNVPHYE